MPIMPMRPDTASGYRPPPVRNNPVGRTTPQNPIRNRPSPSQQAASRGRSTNSAGRYSARPAAPPVEQAGPVQSIDSYLGADVDYQNQLRNFSKTMTDFQADLGRRRGMSESDFAMSKKGLEDQRGKDLESLAQDFASRGLSRSGLYGQAVGDYETEFGRRMSDMQARQQQALAALEAELSQFSGQQNLSEQAAREAAIRRRAETLGI
jgi:hypothetical protein